jgi:hypothetical protein
MKKIQFMFAVVAVSLTIGAAVPATAAPGADIKNACGASFGHLVSGARSTGTAVHGNYAGGAAAFANPAILAAHGCSA